MAAGTNRSIAWKHACQVVCDDFCTRANIDILNSGQVTHAVPHSSTEGPSSVACELLTFTEANRLYGILFVEGNACSEQVREHAPVVPVQVEKFR